MIPTCNTCRAYAQRTDHGGHCWRHPPQLLAVARPNFEGSLIEAHRPWMEPTEWCLDHVPAKDPAHD